MKITQPGDCYGLVFSSKEKRVMRIKAAALELLSHMKFKSQMTQLPCHKLQVRKHALCAFLRRLHFLTSCYW